MGRRIRARPDEDPAATSRPWRSPEPGPGTRGEGPERGIDDSGTSHPVGKPAGEQPYRHGCARVGGEEHADRADPGLVHVCAHEGGVGGQATQIQKVISHRGSRLRWSGRGGRSPSARGGSRPVSRALLGQPDREEQGAPAKPRRRTARRGTRRRQGPHRLPSRPPRAGSMLEAA